MHINICSLNSGSNANCYYIGNDNEAVLIDAGLSCRETEKRMNGLALSMDKLKAIFISHEHSDHVTGLAGISKKYQLPVYITEGTFANCKVPVEENLIQHFQEKKPVSIGNLKITSFKKNHDAADAHSFMVSGYGVNVGVITDIGFACKKVIIRKLLIIIIFLIFSPFILQYLFIPLSLLLIYLYLHLLKEI